MKRWLSFFVWFALAGAGWAAPVRVVSQTVGADEILIAVAERDQIAALSHLAREPAFSAVAEEARQFPHLVQGDAETILKFSPTLVLFADYSRAELVAQVRRAGVRVLILDRYQTLEDAFETLRLVARELGPAAEERAERVIAGGRARVRALEEKLRGVQPVRVIAPSTYGVVGGADTTFQDLCDHAGAVNLASTLGHLRGHQPPPTEQMLTWPIDRVVLEGANLEEALGPFLTLSPYQFLAAVKEKRVALLAPYMLSSVTHHRIDGYERLARELHPEVFK